MEKNNEKISPKHVFLHLFTIVMLYILTVNILVLVFQYINLFVKDALSNANAYYKDYNYEMIRFSLASIIIVLPLFIWGSWFLNKLYLKNPEIRKMKVRKWLIYFTLFIVAIVIVGDLISVVWNFLGGEISMRFFLKAFSILITTGSVFAYYLWDVKREKASKNSKYIAIALIAISLIIIIFGFVKSGSPFKERLRRFDYEKVSNLEDIQSQIIFYWQSKEKLPDQLGDLEDSISGYISPKDPQTGLAYEYFIMSENEFELCANFNLEGDSRYAGGSIVNDSQDISNWKHGVGKHCFKREIDKDLYPSLKGNNN